MNELITLTRTDLDRLRYENAIAAYQERCQALSDALTREQKARKADEERHTRVVRELNSQIRSVDASEQIERLEEIIMSRDDTLGELSKALKVAEAENERLRGELVFYRGGISK